MPNLFCGNCGYPATDPSGCALCQGPVFDLGTPRGVFDCRAYRSLRSEQAQQVSTGYVGLFVGLGVMAISFAVLYVSDTGLGGMGLCEWGLILALVCVGSGLVYAYHRWTRLPQEQVLDQRLWSPDPFHDPAAPEPPRAARWPPTSAPA